MSQSITLHDVTSIKIEENQKDPKHSEGRKKIALEVEDGKDVVISAYGDFETESVSEVVR